MDIKAKFDRAADVFMGKPEALYEQACESYKGKEFERARELFKRAADKGHAASAYEFSLMALGGKAGETDVRLAVKYMRLSVDSDYLPAIQKLASWCFSTEYKGKLLYAYIGFINGSERCFWSDPVTKFTVEERVASGSMRVALCEELGISLSDESILTAAEKLYSRAGEKGDARSSYSAALAKLAMAKDEKSFINVVLRLVSSIKAGIPEAQFIAGWLSFSREEKLPDTVLNLSFSDVKLSIPFSVRCFLAAAKKSFAPAQLRLGHYLLFDFVKPIDGVSGEALLKKAEKTESWASLYLAQYYFSKCNYREIGLRITRLISSFPSDASCNYMYGFMLKKGWGGLKKDEQKAFSLIRKAVIDRRYNDAKAIYELADCYLHGKGVTKDAKQAICLLEPIKNENYDALLSLCRCYRKGIGVDIDPVHAIELLNEPIANADCYQPMSYMIQCDIANEASIDRDALNQIVSGAAKRGIAMAQNDWGEILINGLGVKSDLTQSKYWFEKAAVQGSDDARLNLARLLLDTKDVSEDEREQAGNLLDQVIERAASDSSDVYFESVFLRAGLFAEDGKHEAAFSLYWELADKGNSAALLQCGDYLLEGIGVEKDLSRALECYRRGADLGNAEALERIGRCYWIGLGVEKDDVIAVEYFQQAEKKGSKTASYHYALCLDEGKGVDQDKAACHEIMRNLAQDGYAPAVKWIGDREMNSDPLDDLIGLESVKRELRAMRRHIAFSQDFAAQGGKYEKASHHMLFLGNPGTGKTTVARLVADILCEMGVTRTRNLIEVDRSNLIGEYRGQSGIKAKEAIDKAMGGVLFVDEAYALKSDKGDGLGQEAVDVIVKAMTDYADDLVVIMAGYEYEMSKFLESNSGLASRFRYTFHFENYGADELTQIFNSYLIKQGFTIDEDALDLARGVFERERKAKNFGNARFANNFAHDVIDRHIDKTYDSSDAGSVAHIVATDIPVDSEGENCDELANSVVVELGGPQASLDDLVGLGEVKDELERLRKSLVFAKRVIAKGADLGEANYHMLFLGNPGTGKTTVARIVADMLCEMGATKNCNLVEADRSTLIGEYRGQSTQKVSEAIGRAMGGVLFIDEAYGLLSDSHDGFGQEAIDTLVKAMTDHMGEFVVIMAGYEREMDNFLKRNSGLASRFRYTFHFEDYSADDLLEMFYNRVKSAGFVIEGNALALVFAIFQKAREKEHFGNGRFVSNFFQDVFSRHAFRVADADDESLLTRITTDDIPVDLLGDEGITGFTFSSSRGSEGKDDELTDCDIPKLRDAWVSSDDESYLYIGKFLEKLVGIGLIDDSFLKKAGYRKKANNVLREAGLIQKLPYGSLKNGGWFPTAKGYKKGIRIKSGGEGDDAFVICAYSDECANVISTVLKKGE